MISLCEDCEYIDKCKPHKDNPQSIGCCDFGLFDEGGLIRDLKDWDIERNDEQRMVDKLEKAKQKGDLISRKALKRNEPHYDEEGFRIFYESEIDNSPPVSDFKEGKWRLTLTGDVICSVCKLPRRDTRIDHIQFCNHCGADMRGNNEKRE